MTSIPMRAIERSDNTFAHIESLQQIRPPYPAHGTPEWWALRKRLEELIAKEQRLGKARWTEAELARSKLASNVALGDEQSVIEYERDGKTREWWLRTWNPEALEGRIGIPSNLIKPIP